MKRKDYEKPAMKVVKLQHQAQLLTGSNEVLTHIRISAVYGGNDNTTRAAYTEDGNSITATWESGDELYVCYNGHKNILNLTDGAGTANATFEGTIQGKPFNNSILIC